MPKVIVLVWVPPKVDPESRTQYEESLWKTIPGSSGQRMATYNREEKQ